MKKKTQVFALENELLVDLTFHSVQPPYWLSLRKKALSPTIAVTLTLPSKICSKKPSQNTISSSPISLILELLRFSGWVRLFLPIVWLWSTRFIVGKALEILYQARDKRATFNELMDMCRCNGMAGGAACNPIVFELMVISIMLVQQKKLRELEYKLRDVLWQKIVTAELFESLLDKSRKDP